MGALAQRIPNMALIIRSSSLHGAGVYTNAPIVKGSRVLEYSGPRISAKQSEGLYDGDVTYLFGMDGGKTIIDGFCMAAFVNHSCDPNCESDQIENRVWIIALRDIAAGEELTYDYNIYDADPGDKALCRCGASNCRGTMLCEEEVKRHKRILRQRRNRRRASREARRGGAQGRG
jgi:SET domain-containing protein